MYIRWCSVSPTQKEQVDEGENKSVQDERDTADYNMSSDGNAVIKYTPVHNQQIGDVVHTIVMYKLQFFVCCRHEQQASETVSRFLSMVYP